VVLVIYNVHFRSNPNNHALDVSGVVQDFVEDCCSRDVYDLGEKGFVQLSLQEAQSFHFPTLKNKHAHSSFTLQLTRLSSLLS
jgi:hypothetical protein